MTGTGKGGKAAGTAAVREIPIHAIAPLRIGQTENAAAGTGCTVFLSEEGMRAGLDVRGGGPASRDSRLLDPLAAAEEIHAIVLSGGSAFGLAAAGGVMELLESRGIGFDVGVTRVPLVAQSCLFDLTVGDRDVRPDAAMGREAARLALEGPNYRDGNYGAGCGATVGKYAGMDTCMKSGIGSYAIQIGELQIGAVTAVNALGDIYDWKNGRKVAGLLTEDRQGFRDSVELMMRNTGIVENKFLAASDPQDAAGLSIKKTGYPGNTTLSVVITNGYFRKTQLSKIAGMAHNGYARSIRPVHTSADGDSIYAVSVGQVEADRDLVGTLAAEVISEAILRAVKHAESAYGFPAERDLPFRQRIR